MKKGKVVQDVESPETITSPIDDEGLSVKSKGRAPKFEFDSVGPTDQQCIEATCRIAEFIFSLISWSVLMSAHRNGFEGYYRYTSYVSLKFALIALIAHWSFVTILILFKGNILDAEKMDVIEYLGTIATSILVYSASIAAAAQSTSNHETFGPDDVSICEPHEDALAHEKRRATYFCERVTVSVTFMFFTSISTFLSFWFVILRKQLLESRVTYLGDKSPVI